jgi:hypothetical protein
LVPFFQGVPSDARHWSEPLAAFNSSAVGVCASAASGAARAADANSTATLFNFFMILLSKGKPQLTCVTSKFWNREPSARPARAGQRQRQIIVP